MTTGFYKLAQMRCILLEIHEAPAVQHPHPHTAPGKENTRPSCSLILTGALGWHEEASGNQIH